MNRLKALQKCLIAGKLDSFEQWRSQSTIDKDELIRIYYGPNFQVRQDALETIRQNPNQYKHHHLLESSRQEMRKSSAELMFFNKDKNGLNYGLLADQPNKFSMLFNAWSAYSNGFTIKNGVHLILYAKGIHNLGTQKHKKWAERACNFQDIGCFGLTQLLHGSNVRGILTESHYDHQNKQFIINSPTKEAMKFWIGAASQIANNALIWAQLYIDGKCYGVHPYIVPIRDKRTHKLLPGVLIGDCGPKNGHNEIDNGFILFDNVRIPKDNQLDRISGVDENGKFRSIIQNADKRFGLQLGTLSAGRFLVGGTAGANALSALTIAIRYVCIRRQFSDKQGQKQNLLMEYPLTKRRLMPLLAQCFVYTIGNNEITYEWDTNQKSLLDPENQLIAELHAISSVTKPKLTWMGSEVIKQCRQMLGGHGFSSFSKLGTLYSDNDIHTTWEGDNHVLLQQTAKYALDAGAKMMKGKPIKSKLLAFLPNAPSQSQIQINEEFVQSPESVEKFLQYKIKAKLQDMGMKLMELKEKNISNFDAWNSVQVFLGKNLALTIGDLFFLQAGQRALKKFKSEANKKVVNDLLILWQLKMLREDEFIDQKHHGMIEDIMADYCQRVSRQSLGLLDAISADDLVIGSPFADPNGHGFEKYMKLIMNSKDVMKKPDWWKLIANRGQ